MLKNNQKSFIYIHIPKVAGSTLQAILERQYAPHEMFTVQDHRIQGIQRDFTRLSPQQQHDIRCITGHMFFGLHEVLERQFTYITLLREPIDRVISHYYYVLRNPEHPLYHQVTVQQMSLKDYIRSGLSEELDNGQTRFLAAANKHIAPFGHCSSELLDIAKRNIQNHFAVVGLSERFDETLMLLKHYFQWTVPVYRKRNVTKNRPGKEQFSQETLDAIAEYNALDIELYHYASEQFEDAVTIQVTRQVTLFRWLNRVYQCVHSGRT